jgi:peptidoglycan/xylan/chitin deacetylase (PgdA/CDA1 family)
MLTAESQMITSRALTSPIVGAAIHVYGLAGRGTQLTVITFHRALAEADSLLKDEPDGHVLRIQLSQWGKWFRFQALSDAVHDLRNSALKRSVACVTFDDGYADNLEIAAPVLASLGIPATFFVATKFSDGGMMFNDRVISAVRAARGDVMDATSLGFGSWSISSLEEKRAAINGLLSKVKHLPYEERERVTIALPTLTGAQLDPHPMMTREQVKTLASKGFEIGAHTISHPILREIPDEQARFEITEGRRQLQELTGQKVEMFAYPNGRPGEDYDLRHVQMVKDAGFIGAVSTIPGAASKDDDLYQIPRFTPWHGASWKSGVQFLRNYRTPIRALKA